MADLYAALHDWQDLVGAVVGGLFALLVALRISSASQRRAEQVAANIAMSTLADFVGTAELWQKAWDAQPEKETHDYNLWMADRIMFAWPHFASDIEAARAVLMDVDWEIGGRLDIFIKSYRAMQDARVQITELTRMGRFNSMSTDAIRAATTLVIGLTNGAESGGIAMHLIDRLVLSRRWRINRLLRSRERLTAPSSQD